MAKIEFRIDAKPPKKTSEKSMWTLNSQAPLVNKLRMAAYKEKEKLHIEPFKGDICMNIEVHLPSVNNNPNRPDLFWGDLDNIVSGICDSLQKAYNEYTFKDNDPVHGNALLYYDDNQIISIKAVKIVNEEVIPYYILSIEENEVV